MLGDILKRLTNPDTAAEILASVGERRIVDRASQAAAGGGVPVGVLVAEKIRHMLDHGNEDVWLDLMGVMANSPRPAIAAIERMLARAFPDPMRVRIRHPGHTHDGHTHGGHTHD
jgi:hypothetical protein